jgi:hypothetical protein
MAASFKARDGKAVTDGQKTTLTLVKGSEETHDYSEREVKGTVRAFEHVERVYDEEGIAIGKTSETKWEITTGDPVYPAVGFLPENVLTRTGA